MPDEHSEVQELNYKLEMLGFRNLWIWDLIILLFWNPETSKTLFILQDYNNNN